MRSKRKILVVFGTRPEAIKMAPVILALKKSNHFEVLTCVTGQHREMLDQVLEFFEIKPDFDLKLMRPNQTLNGIASGVLSQLDPILASEKFDCLVVHGDTTTTMAASLAGFHRKVEVAHVEAGLRTQNLKSPWPEEMNRRVAGLVGRWHFAPTVKSEQNLLRENVSREQIFVTGNTVIDALHIVVSKLKADRETLSQMEHKFSFLNPDKKMILITGHRRENFGDQFIQICEGLKRLAVEHDVQLVYPVHLNPNVQDPVKRILGDLPNVFLLEPQNYVPFVYLMNRCHFVITDSGGVQEEAPSIGKPVLVMRETTERPEAVEVGAVRLVGSRAEEIYRHASELILNPDEYRKMSQAISPYGDGQSSKRIVEILENEV